MRLFASLRSSIMTNIQRGKILFHVLLDQSEECQTHQSDHKNKLNLLNSINEACHKIFLLKYKSMDASYSEILNAIRVVVENN